MYSWKVIDDIIILWNSEERAIAHHRFAEESWELGNLWTDIIHECFAWPSPSQFDCARWDSSKIHT